MKKYRYAIVSSPDLQNAAGYQLWAGGIQVEVGGTLNLWGGCITQNASDTSGGGILLKGQGPERYPGFPRSVPWTPG